MVAYYKVQFREPWQGVLLTGTFNRWVNTKNEAFDCQMKYEKYYKAQYEDEYAKVKLVSVI